MKKLISICLSVLCAFAFVGVNTQHAFAEDIISLEQFLVDLYADGVFDGKNTTVVQWSPDETNGTVIQRIQSHNAQYGIDQFADVNANVTITNTSFRYVPADIPNHKDSWNPTVKTWKASEIVNAEFQFENAGNVTIENCTFNQVLVSPYGQNAPQGTSEKPNDNTRQFIVRNCTFNDIYDTYALKDIYPYSVEITNNSFNNCSGAIYFEGVAERGNITISGNTFNTIDTNADVGEEYSRGIIQLSANFNVGDSTNFVMEGNTIAGNLVKNGKDDPNRLPVFRLITKDMGLIINGWTAGQPLSILVNTEGAPLPALETQPQTVNGVTYTFRGWLDEATYEGATANYENTQFYPVGYSGTSDKEVYYAVWKVDKAPEPTVEPTPTSTPDTSNDDHRSCDIKGDLNCDGVVTCDEAMGPGWVWDEQAKACVMNTPVETTPSTTSTYQIVNTSDK